MPKLAPWAFALVVLALIIWRATRNTRSMVDQTLARRPNPTREEFLAELAPSVSPATAIFLWDTILPYVTPALTPHPDDHLWNDLPIDEDDVTMDWPSDFAKTHGRKLKSWPAWPDGTPVTVRNFGLWLDAASRDW
ncbi:MAG: hypothetical protein KGM49_02905 [Sphingomonadales bacterium]|nr:hypothetical protein [Sphingomonadales bacterium]